MIIILLGIYISWNPSTAQDATTEGAEDKEEAECQS